MHITSSPRYPQSNGFIERMVQTVKIILEKAKQSRMDYQMALLNLRTTPLDSQFPSPAEILHSRKIRTKIPTLLNTNNPKDNQTRELTQHHNLNRPTQTTQKLNTPTTTTQPVQPIQMQTRQVE